MVPAAVEALKFIKSHPKGVTVKGLTERFGVEDTPILIDMIQLHVNTVKGKMTVNDAGEWILEQFKDK